MAALSYKDRLRKLLDGDDAVLKSLNDEINQVSKNLETYEDRVAKTQQEMARYRNVLDEKIRSSKEIVDSDLSSTTEKRQPPKAEPRKAPTVNLSSALKEKPIYNPPKVDLPTEVKLPNGVLSAAVHDDSVDTTEDTGPLDPLQKIIKEASERRIYSPRVVDNYFASPYRDKPTNTKNIPDYAKRYFESKDNIESKHIISRFNYMPR
jgi:hypothetical protein